MLRPLLAITLSLSLFFQAETLVTLATGLAIEDSLTALLLSLVLKALLSLAFFCGIVEVIMADTRPAPTYSEGQFNSARGGGMMCGGSCGYGTMKGGEIDRERRASEA